MTAVMPAAAAGALLGLAVRAAMPARRDLSSMLDRLDASKTAGGPLLSAAAAPTSAGTLSERVGGRLLGEFGGRLTLPVKDLNLLRISPAAHLGKRFLYAVYGLLLPQLVQALLAAAGAPFPFALPVLFSLAMAGLFWFWPVKEVARDAAAARLVVRHAAASYLERVALARIANSGAAQALTQTAEVGDGFIFVRMRQVFHQADLSGITVWDAL
ncbi:hypothetical protein ACFWH1_28310, partial [Streptomyces sp. NPDC127037]|uniref:hypothetical protein n=1 Tax=Streptomyces sp. NPDC127037 TaxID=3347113 RepID=UPI00364FD26C